MTPDQKPGWAGDSSLVLPTLLPCLDSRENSPLHGGPQEAGRASLPSFIFQGKLPLFLLFRAKAAPDVLRWARGALEWARALETIGWEEVGVGLSFLCLQFDLFASRLFWFSTWRDLGTLSKVQTPSIFPASSSRALGGDWPRLLRAQIWTFHVFFMLDHEVFLLVKNFRGKVGIRVCIFCCCFLPPRQKTWGKLLRWFRVEAIPFFLIATEFSCKICEQLTTKKLNKWKNKKQGCFFQIFP